MKKTIHYLFVVVCSCLIMFGCPAQEQAAAEEISIKLIAETESIPEATTEISITVTAEEDAVVVTEESVLPETESEYAIPIGPIDRNAREPVLELPEVSDEPCDFFSDAAFIGDSISYSLFVYQNKTGELGNPLFLVRGSLGLQNALMGRLRVYYRGKEMTPWEALEASGVKKVFIMLGTNDIGYYGIDETMDRWTIFLDNIREACPDIQIYIQSLTPMWTEAEQGLLNNENIDIYNQRLEKFADNNDCHFVNIAPYFKDSTNGLAEKYSNDQYVHMCEEGISAWVKLLKAYAAEQEKEIS